MLKSYAKIVKMLRIAPIKGNLMLNINFSLEIIENVIYFPFDGLCVGT